MTLYFHISVCILCKNVVSECQNKVISLSLSIAVATIKLDPYFFIMYATKFSICRSDIGPLLNPRTQLLVNERLEMYSLLLDQCFTSPVANRIAHDPVSYFSNQYINPDECHTDIEITESIIIDSINELSSTSTAEPDGIFHQYYFCKNYVGGYGGLSDKQTLCLP